MTSSLPTFIVVGSVKCGTTSLHYYLSQHPQVCVSRPKELDFFIGEESLSRPDDSSGSWRRGPAWYERHFDPSKSVRGEVSPRYVGGSCRSQVFARMSSIVPNAKIILLVREPMDRLRSHYVMARHSLQTSAKTLTEYVTDPRSSQAITWSDYGSQIACILDHFPLSSLHVVESTALEHDRHRTLSELFGFIGADPGFRCRAFEERLFDRRARRFPSPAGERILRSRVMRLAQSTLPFIAREALRNLVLRPFSIPEPSAALDGTCEAELRGRFAAEVSLARRLTGLPLGSLGP